MHRILDAMAKFDKWQQFFSQPVLSAIKLSGLILALGIITHADTTMTIFSTSLVPSNANATDNQPYEMGVQFSTAVNGQITAIRYYKSSGEPSTTGFCLHSALCRHRRSACTMMVAVPARISCGYLPTRVTRHRFGLLLLSSTIIQT